MYSFGHNSAKFSLFLDPKQPMVEAKSIAKKDLPNLDLPSQPWRPTTFRRPFMAAMILLTAILIAALVILLQISSHRQGILFAEEINNLPLHRSFSYLYLPTIISVVYSFLWSWIDLDIKRLEPFYQLSNAEGATGKNSVLLSYPLEFLITVPFSAFKRRHWNVLSGSVTMMLIFWGLTPTQSGIFAVRTVTVVEALLGQQSTAYRPLAQQGNLSSDYAQSVYNIAWLNETLPPFMSKEFVLSPFGVHDTEDFHGRNSTLTMATTMYSVDVECTPANLRNTSGRLTYDSTEGCQFSAPAFRPMGGGDLSKPFDTLYAGYQNQDGFADYYLSSNCKDSKFSHLFFVRWSKMSPEGIRSANESGNVNPDLVANDTSIFCQATYYHQQVNATISMPSQEVLHTQPLDHSEKSALPADIFNVSSFEWAMASGQEQVALRGDYPITAFPSQQSQLLGMPINLAYIPKMAPFAIATYTRPAQDYLDPETLRKSYESAYRLLFARQLSEILSAEIDYSKDLVNAKRSYITQAVVVVPGFAYAAITMLVLVLLLACGLFATIPRRENKLQYDPATLGALMDLVRGDSTTANIYGTFGDAGTDSLEGGIGDVTFRLSKSPPGNINPARLRLLRSTASTELTPDDDPMSPLLDAPPTPPKQGIRPFEMKLVSGAVFLTLQVAAIITFTVLFIRAKTSNGLALPSQSTFVRQVVENYIPIALATLAEPFWLVLNRLLGLLQPFEELRKGTVAACRSVDIDYSSLPPQLLMVRALKARHYVLVLVCFMVLLANVLAVALSGLMYESTASLGHESPVKALYSTTVRSLNGTGLPFNGALEENFDGSTTVEQFYRMMSNLTADTPLPPWADDDVAYMPIDINGVKPDSTLQVDTTTLGANLSCEPLATHGPKRYDLAFWDNGGDMNITVILPSENGTSVQCTNPQSWISAYGPSAINALNGNPNPGHQALEFNSILAVRNGSTEDDLFCRQHILAGWVRADWKATGGKTIYDRPKVKLISKNETLLLCRPEIISGGAKIIIDSQGHVHQNVDSNNRNPIQYQGQTDYWNFIAQINQFLVNGEATWHNDSYPSDLTNYLIKASENITSLLDPTKPAPSAEAASAPFSKVYRKLFAILVATSFHYLFDENTEGGQYVAVVRTPETRIFFSTPAFIVTQTILVLYVFTSVFFYARRPWRVLPRLPSSIASNIAFFATSQALKDLSGLDVDCSTRAVRESWRWGYGSFVDGDGRRHIGIERQPYVRALEKEC